MPLMKPSAFNKTLDGKQIALYTLKSEGGLTMQVTNYGLRIVSLFAPDRDGNYADVAIGKENIQRYLDPNDGERYLGCIVGRYANRIASGAFSIGDSVYRLPINNNGQTLHGGLTGLDRVVWDVDSCTRNAIHFHYISPDGADGFPGNLSVYVAYELTADNACKITYRASTDMPTAVNLSNHCFFNLKGEGGGAITGHVLTINAQYFLPVDSVLIPTGELMNVEGTPFDFRSPRAIGERIGQEHIQLKHGNGYDHCWALHGGGKAGVEHAATLYEPLSGRKLMVYTDQAGMQFYAGNFFDGAMLGKYGKSIGRREALALETQNFPDSPNQPHFPNAILLPNQEYTHTCIYKFATDKD